MLASMASIALMAWPPLALSAPSPSAPSTSAAQSLASSGSPGLLDVSTLKVGAPASVADLDLGKLKWAEVFSLAPIGERATADDGR